MTEYVTLENALWMVENAYLLSVVLLLAVSYIGLAAIEMIEEPGDNSPLPKWFS